MKILLVYPECPNTFWSFQHALKFIQKKASGPPLGLLTVAAMLPKSWNLQLVDMNVEKLHDRDLLQADYVFISAMSIQRDSVNAVIDRCHQLGCKVVAGGPLFTAHYDEFDRVDHFILNEAEITLPPFLADLDAGRPQRLYRSDNFAEMSESPLPRWDLAKLNRYATMNVQYSRGCPFHCNFCDITVLFGRKPRLKKAAQLLAELEALYNAGWRSNIFLVDDNFIGNKGYIKREVLPALVEWMHAHRNPFQFSTEATINLADDADLMSQMVDAGFDTVFVGIESPNEESLLECNKVTNKNRDLLDSIHRIQSAGLQIQGGFIVGFDNDPPTIFKQITHFIQESGIVTAMVGMLNVPRGTTLHEQMRSEGRLLQSMTGSNTDFTLNFIPKMNPNTLIEGYRSILEKIYSPKHYYARVKRYIGEYKQVPRGGFRFRFPECMALFRSFLVLGMLGKERVYYWKLVIWSLFRHPRLIPHSITLAIYGFHFRKVTEYSTRTLRNNSLA